MENIDFEVVIVGGSYAGLSAAQRKLRSLLSTTFALSRNKSRKIPEQLGCAVNQQGLLELEMFQQTTIPGVYAAGDNSNMARSVAMAVSSGSMAGAMINRELIEEAF